MVTAAQKNKLSPLMPVVRAHREFISKLIVQWLDNSRGIWPFQDKGVKEGGPKSIKVGNKTIDLSKAYNLFVNSPANRKNAKYDTLRAAALAAVLSKDFAHTTGSAVSILTGVGRSRSLNGLSGSHCYMSYPLGAFGNAASDAAAQGGVPPQDIDWGAIATSVAEFFGSILPYLAELLAWEDVAVTESGTAVTLPGGAQVTLPSPARPAPVFVPPAPPPAPVAKEPPVALLVGGGVVGLGLVYLLMRKRGKR